MVFVKRANVVLEVHEDFLPQYLAKGFDQIDEKTGKVVEKGMTNNFNSLQMAYVELNKENRKLLVENQRLLKENEELKKKLAHKKSAIKADKE